MSSNDNTTLDPVRFSRLKLMGKSAAHYALGRSDETASMRKGTAVHSYLLGDAERVKVYAGKRDKRVKAYQAFLEENPDCDILSPREAVDVEGMRVALQKHDRASELLDGIREERIEWTLAGRACAGTPDVVHLRANGGKTLVELKTSQSSAPDLFRWQARKLAYHAQLAWYGTGLETALVYKPGPVEEQYVVVVESAPPWPVTVFRVTDALRRAGERQYRVWFEHLLVCERTGNWPGYVESDVELDEDEIELEWETAGALSAATALLERVRDAIPWEYTDLISAVDTLLKSSRAPAQPADMPPLDPSCSMFPPVPAQPAAPVPDAEPGVSVECECGITWRAHLCPVCLEDQPAAPEPGAERYRMVLDQFAKQLDRTQTRAETAEAAADAAGCEWRKAEQRADAADAKLAAVREQLLEADAWLHPGEANRRGFDSGRAVGREDVGKYARAIGEIEGLVGITGAVPLRDTVAAVRALQQSLTSARESERRLRERNLFLERHWERTKCDADLTDDPPGQEGEKT